MLALAQEIKAGTIGKVLATDDFELGWSALIKTLPTPTAPSTERTDLPVDADPEQLANPIRRPSGQSWPLPAWTTRRSSKQWPAIKRLLADDNLQDLCSRRPSFSRYLGIVEDVMPKLLSEDTQKLASYPNA